MLTHILKLTAAIFVINFIVFFNAGNQQVSTDLYIYISFPNPPSKCNRMKSIYIL